jgi:hypothetical protein
MRAKHGVATSDDVSKLRDPLSHALTSLSDLTGHMDSFLLASQRLTRSGQGETDYKCFELFLEIVSGFPSVSASMTGYYTQYPASYLTDLARMTFECRSLTTGKESTCIDLSPPPAPDSPTLLPITVPCLHPIFPLSAPPHLISSPRLNHIYPHLLSLLALPTLIPCNLSQRRFPP